MSKRTGHPKAEQTKAIACKQLENGEYIYADVDFADLEKMRDEPAAQALSSQGMSLLGV